MSRVTRYDVVVVGAGAAGLMAAIFAARSAEEGATVVALDGASRIGAKILISGGGRCNVTNSVVTSADFSGDNRNRIAKVLKTFDVAATVTFFEELGVRLVTESTDKLFPESNRARTVLDALLQAMTDSGARVLSDHRVESVEVIDGGFRLLTSGGEIEAGRVVLATGGRSIPKTGSDGRGYAIARALGHSVTPVFPALVPLVAETGHWIGDLSGTSCEVELRVQGSSGKTIARRSGSMLFAHFGVTGPAALDISRDWIAARRDDAGAVVVANLVPGESFEQMEKGLLDESQKNPRAFVASFLRARMTQRLAEQICQKVAGVDPRLHLGRLTREGRRSLAHALTSWPLPLTGDRGFDYAEVTAGGVPLTELDLSSMESKIYKGLHLCGEILDVDGRIGGFNFQWAWASGRLAGIGACGHPS